MEMYTNLFKNAGAENTWKEIRQQPGVWCKMADGLTARKAEICDFLQRVEKVENLRTVFTGAGSSAFIGESLQQQIIKEGGLWSEAIHTTDIVSSPQSTLYDVPTLIVSYSRSGESPESVGALKYAALRITKLYNIIISCKRDSSLSRYAEKISDTLLLYMPPECCDLGFAMTSSVSSMALATWCIFGWKEFNKRIEWVRRLSNAVEDVFEHIFECALKTAAWDFDRIIYLGSGPLRGLAREAAVKILELTGGKIVAQWDTPMGFRHGPKSIINKKTVTVHFIAQDPHTYNYDMDVLKEIINQRKGNRVIRVGVQSAAQECSLADMDVLYKKTQSTLGDMSAHIMGLVFAQLLGLVKSVNLGLKADNPSEEGDISRIVKGVNIYPLHI